MIKKIMICLLIGIIISILYSCSARNYEIYISPNGNDSSSGSRIEPLATLQQALELVEEKAGKIPVTIYLFGGKYELSEPLEFKLRDSGTKDAPIEWKAVPGENPIISGGISIKNWVEEGNDLWSATIPEGMNEKFRSFYVNDKRAVRARFPNEGYLKVEKAGKDNRTNFFFKKNDIPKVSNIQNLEIIFLHDWSITRIGVKSIDWENNNLKAVDTIGSRIQFFNINNWEEHPRYYLENTKEFCDSPGEWYCDFNEQKIYYLPLQDEKIDESEGVIPVATKLITIKGTKTKNVGYINFNGITFENTDWLLPDKGYCGIQACMYDDRSKREKEWSKVPAAIELDDATNCGFYDCTIKHTGGSGIWLRENCSSCIISGTHIYDISGNGINIGEGRDRLSDGIPWWKSAPEEVSINNSVTKSLIEDCGKQFFGAVGIWGGLVANTRLSHNEIRDLPYTGISIGWMWDTTATPCRANQISSNHIHDVMNILSDGGGIYSLGQQPGSQIIDNLIHDVTINAGRAESNGMFLDEGTRDVVVENNIIFNIARSPLRFHKAFSNLVRNNVLVCPDNIPPIRYNRTKEENIKRDGNIVLNQSSKEDMQKLKNIVDDKIARMKSEIDL